MPGKTLNKVIVFDRDDGGVSVVHLIKKAMRPGETEDQFIAREKNRLFGSSPKAMVKNFSDLPAGRDDRDKWKMNRS